MGKDHLKRLAAPKTWNVKRKGLKFITKPAPGPHSLESGMPLNVLLKEVLGYANTTKESKKILKTNEIKIDGKSRKDFRFPIGIFDTLEIATTGTSAGESFRVVLNKKGKIDLIKIKKDEAALKPCKIIGKTMVGGKTGRKLQLNLFDGKNILVESNSSQRGLWNESDKTYKAGDTILVSLPELKIVKHLKLAKRAAIFLTGGKHIGEIGVIDDLVEGKVIYKDNKGNLIETSKEYAFVVGDNKPAIQLNKDHLSKDESNEEHQN